MRLARFRVVASGNVAGMSGKNHSESTRRKLSDNTKRNPTRYWLGKERPQETLLKMSKAMTGKFSKERHYNWKGGITPINKLIRTSGEYKQWRSSVFRRDGWACVLCKYRSKKSTNGRSDIHADHIKLFSLYPELRLEVSNGRTLCVPCHKEVTFKHA